MIVINKCLLFTLLAIIFCSKVYAGDSQYPVEARTAKYVSVSFELYGLEETAIILNNAAKKIVVAMEGLNTGTNDLSPEQLDKIAIIARETNVAIQSLDKTLKNVVPAINKVREPTKAMIKDILLVARETTIDPA